MDTYTYTRDNCKYPYTFDNGDRERDNFIKNIWIEFFIFFLSYG